MRRVIPDLFFATLLICLLCSSLLATKHAPLPDRILQAKTVYIDDQSGIADIADKAYDELTKWGRFKIVSSVTEADVVLLLSAKAYVAGYRTSSSGTTSQMSSSGTVSQTTAEMGRTTYLTIVDPKTGDALWGDLRSNGAGGGLLTRLAAAHAAANAVRGLVKELRERIDEQQR